MRRPAITIGLIVMSILSAQHASADQSDDYVARVIGKAVVHVHGGMDSDRALEKICDPLSRSLPEDELEGISDFVYMTIDRLNASSVSAH